MHELLVAANLMKRGFSVFRALSPSSPGDLAILKDGKLMIVEVTSGTRTYKNTLVWPLHSNGKHDVIAIVEYAGDITYIPELP